MEMKKVQERIVHFAEQRARAKGVEYTPEIAYIHLTEELGEVAQQLFNKKLRPDLFDEENLREEIVDVILESLILADLCKVNLDHEVGKKIDNLFEKHRFKEKAFS